MYNTLVTLASSAAGGLAGGNAGAGAAFNEVTNNDLKHQSIDPKKLAEMNGINPLAVSPNGQDDLKNMRIAAKDVMKDVTIQVGSAGNASAYLGGVYVEDGYAIGIGYRGMSLYQYSTSANIYGPQQGASAGLVVSISPGSPTPGTMSFTGFTVWGKPGLGGNFTFIKDSSGNYGFGRAAFDIGPGESSGMGVIHGVQTTTPVRLFK